MSYITEAFKALDCLNEETFAISDDGINKLAQFEQSDDLSDDITVYDMDAETEDDLEDSYVGKVILDCCVCHSKIYKDKSEVSIDEEQEIANIDMECPYCYSQEGFKVIGEVAPMTAEESTSETSAETDADSTQESLKEDVEVNYEIEKLNESSWAEITREWTPATEDKLNVIRDAGLFDELRDEVHNLEGITGLYTNCYRAVSPAYSDITEAQLKDSRKKMFALIKKYYMKAQELNGDLEKDLKESKSIKESAKIIRCPDCKTEFTSNDELDKAMYKGVPYYICSVCETPIKRIPKSELDPNNEIEYEINESKSIKESVDKTLDKAIDKYFDGEVRDYKVNGDKVDVTFKDGSQKTFNKSIFDESLNEASTDRVQKLLSIIDNSFEVLEDAPINEDALEEAKQIRLSSVPGVTRDPSNDFADDGNRFQAYLYKGVVPITYLRAGGDVYITIAFHHLEDINYDEYKEFPSYKNADEFNGVPADTFNAEIFQKNLEDAYKDIVDFLGSVEDVDSAQLEDRITSINNACKEYEEKVKQYIQDNALKIMKLSDYQFRNLKNYVSSAGNRTADYIRNASSSSQRHFMSRDLESLKRQISNSWNFEYIEDILNSVQESITESPALSKVTGTLGAALDAHKEELANATTSEALVELLNRIRPEVKEGQQAYLDSVIERVKRLPAIKGMQFVYNLILKGDGMSTKLDAAKPRKKATNESLEETLSMLDKRSIEEIDGVRYAYDYLTQKDLAEVKDIVLKLLRKEFPNSTFEVYSITLTYDELSMGVLKDDVDFNRGISIKLNRFDYSDNLSKVLNKYTPQLAHELIDEMKSTIFDISMEESLKESVNSDIVSTIKKQFPKSTIKTSVRKHSDVHKSNPDTPTGKTKYVDIRITPDEESSVNAILQYCNHNIKKVLDSDNRFYYYGDVPARNPRGGKEVVLSYQDYSGLSDDEYRSLLGESVNPADLTDCPAEGEFSWNNFSLKQGDLVDNDYDYDREEGTSEYEIIDTISNSVIGYAKVFYDNEDHANVYKLEFNTPDIPDKIRRMDFAGNYPLEYSDDLSSYCKWLDSELHKRLNESLKESVKDVTITTDDSRTTMTSEDDGKVTVTTEPVEQHKHEEVIEPISDETRDSIENGETDVDIEDMDTDAFDELGESYLKRVYENVSAYKTSKVSTQDNKFVVEGLITFDTGNQKSTSFVFESANCTKDGRLKFIGENMQIAKGEKAFSLIGTADNKKFVTESFNYNYRAKNNIGKSTRLYGTIKRG